jgi:hypothetical protein
MNFKNWKPWEKVAMAAFICVLIVAIIFDLYAPNSYGKFIGLAAFGALCVAVRARAFFAPKRRK